VDGKLNLSDSSSLAELQRKWGTLVATPSLPWFAEEKARQGAFAALITFELYDAPARVWRAAAVGDSCLFHLRAGVLQSKFPLTQAADFDLRPYLIGSRSDCRDVIARVELKEESWEPGDGFLLMSDALARWFLSEVESERHPWDEIAQLPEENQPDRFRQWVEGLRQAGCLWNDDTTLLRIAVAE
jgi:hypothetical protein